VARVLGYHGCQKLFADGVRSGRITLDQWMPSQNLYDWLGKGIYLWENSRSRAKQWAIEQFADEADVLEMEIDLGQCLDFLESTYHDDLRATYKSLRTQLRGQGLKMPMNRGKLHNLDNLVINNFVEVMRQERIHFQTVRGVFEEGRPVFPGSALRTQSHMQIAVRDVECLRIKT
jgi:hypothetical protein